ncbi:MAG: glutamate--tRNA ligase, partial [Bdellovibrio sp.]
HGAELKEVVPLIEVSELKKRARQILGEDRQKLSKRHGATSLHEFKEKGFLPEALINYLSLLGWSHSEGKEILSFEELVHNFDIYKLHPSPAVFDPQKLKWMNAVHLRGLDHEELWRRLQPFLKDLQLPQDPVWRDRALHVLKTSMETLTDAPALFRPFAKGAFALEDSSKAVLSWESSRSVIKEWHQQLESFSQDFLTEEDFLTIQNHIKKECQVKGKFLFMPIRVAVLGKPHGAELKEVVPLIEVSELKKRARQILGD